MYVYVHIFIYIHKATWAVLRVCIFLNSADKVIESDDDGPLTKLSSDFFGRPAKVARTAETLASQATIVI